MRKRRKRQAEKVVREIRNFANSTEKYRRKLMKGAIEYLRKVKAICKATEECKKCPISEI